MKLTFLGTRGNIEARSPLHRRHSALLIETKSGRAMFDCGADWAQRLEFVNPDVIFLTHAHPDHAGGLAAGAPCPVYASEATWRSLRAFPVRDKRVIATKRAIRAVGLRVRAFGLLHSVLAPAVGYRVEQGGGAIFYAPDIVAVIDREKALEGVGLYIGDGSSPIRPMVRRRHGAPFGHTTIHAQIEWCARAHIPDAIFTHCGSQIVRADGRAARAQIRGMGRAKGVRARLARDGLEIEFP